MHKGEAHAILNQVKLGMYFSKEKINEALFTTGDLDINQLTPKASGTLRKDGNESCYVRSSSLESEGIGGGFKWSVDWNSKRSGSETQGVQR